MNPQTRRLMIKENVSTPLEYFRGGQTYDVPENLAAEFVKAGHAAELDHVKQETPPADPPKPAAPPVQPQPEVKPEPEVMKETKPEQPKQSTSPTGKGK